MRYFSAALATLTVITSTWCTDAAPEERPAVEITLDVAPPETPTSSTPYFADGLNEYVLLVNGTNRRPQAKYVLREDGTQQSFAHFLSDARDAHALRFGALTPSLARAMEELDGGAEMEVSIHFHGPDPQLLRSDRAMFVDSIESARTSFIARAREVATVFDVVASARSLSVLTARTTADDLRRISRMPETMLVAFSHSTGTTHQAPSPPTWASGAGLILSSPSLTGFGQKIGIVEVAQCRINHLHETFGSTSVVYEDDTENECLYANSQCSRCQGPFANGGSGLCVDLSDGLYCYVNHMSKAASAAIQENYGAYGATLYVPNVGAPFGSTGYRATGCSAVGIADSYDWLASQGVTVVSESFTCALAGTDGIAQDYYSRYGGTLTFKSAGNLGGREDEPTSEACRWSASSVCVGASKSNLSEVASFSNVDNPSSGFGDREEPDIVLLGEDVDVVGDVPDLDTYAQAGGTSFSAPTAAAMTAMFAEFCDPHVWSPIALRALIIHAGIANNLHGPKYSTPGVSDYRDGGGMPDLSTLIRYCDLGSPPDPSILLQQGELDPEESTPLPSYIDDWGGELDPVAERTAIASWGSGRHGQVLTEVSLNQGEEVRVVFTWNPCPVSATGTAPAPNTDFDIHLCSEGSSECIGWSQSFMDVNEGFHVEVPETGTYQLWVSHEDDPTICDGDTEPFFWVLERGY